MVWSLIITAPASTRRASRSAARRFRDHTDAVSPRLESLASSTASSMLSTGITGIAFRTADRAARNLGLAPDAPERIEAALVYLLGQAAGNGHTLLPEARLFGAARDLLGEVAQEGPLSDALAMLVTRREVILDEDLRVDAAGVPQALIYLPMYNTCERNLAANLATLASAQIDAVATVLLKNITNVVIF